MAARIALVAWVLGWYLKLVFDVPYFLQVIYQYPVRYAFFPEFFQEPGVAMIAFFAPLPVAIVALIRKEYIPAAAIVFLISSVILSLHIDVYNDATNVTSFWTALWLLWFSSRLADDREVFYLQARTLAQCVVGMIFLGGFVGKLTPEYWRGEVVTQIFVGNPSESPLRQILFTLPEAWRGLAVIVLSGSIIVTEFIMSLAPLFSYRRFVFLALPVFAVFALFSTWRIYCVLFCLAGILTAGLLLEKSKRAAV